jgi:DNA mismatch endonuclease (patch repair protein)
MSRIKGSNTAPEKLVRSLLHWWGYRFRIHRKDLPGKPDVVLPIHRKIIFVNGCFWHGHAACKKGVTRPVTNARFWANKISGNVGRDRVNRNALRRSGWKVLTVWECETKRPDRLVSKLLRFLQE